ncbi:MAG: hypothetical protein IJ514_06655 [Clostridia bacterium]|nr:hypothetical protein [Clostridia bacterium]
MNEIRSANQIKTLTAPFWERGFAFEYFYQKGGDSSCVYICRYKKGKDYFDWREASGSNEINLVVCVNGEYRFPSLRSLYKKEYRAFRWKHLFKRSTLAERRTFFASLLCKELASDKPDFFGIAL